MLNLIKCLTVWAGVVLALVATLDAADAPLWLGLAVAYPVGSIAMGIAYIRWPFLERVEQDGGAR